MSDLVLISLLIQTAEFPAVAPIPAVRGRRPSKMNQFISKELVSHFIKLKTMLMIYVLLLDTVVSEGFRALSIKYFYEMASLNYNHLGWGRHIPAYSPRYASAPGSETNFMYPP